MNLCDIILCLVNLCNSRHFYNGSILHQDIQWAMFMALSKNLKSYIEKKTENIMQFKGNTNSVWFEMHP